jgi:hypothetical protein
MVLGNQLRSLDPGRFIGPPAGKISGAMLKRLKVPCDNALACKAVSVPGFAATENNALPGAFPYCPARRLVSP